ncbi:glycosyltransferase family 4 protein [Lignipirellula cremea]|uniref:D-inositol-3-phosphate glycosyltransferase n=1 Tax=Lignipirellula cremea TaxID=2528010 RepID=A0A518DZT2_9BACT|nr:glycosyltransferase family 4 protein [Lignipirellula cremea]QDU97349.1 D-inositol-3-phosphate glycosyltransferase [Lignipirellula cremea]
MRTRILQIYSHRNGFTPSGVMCDSIARQDDRRWTQQAIIATTRNEPHPRVGRLENAEIHPVVFGATPIDFSLPTIYPQAPYPATRFELLGPSEVRAYRTAWTRRIEAVVAQFQPDLIYSHHAWLVSSFIKQAAPRVPLIIHCHGDELELLQADNALAEEVRQGCAQAERFIASAPRGGALLTTALGVSPQQVHALRPTPTDDFYPPDRSSSDSAGSSRPGLLAAAPDRSRLLFRGKLSVASGLPWLLDIVDRLRVGRPGLQLHVVGVGVGREAATLEEHMRELSDCVCWSERLDNRQLADAFRDATHYVSPGFFAGVPQGILEAAASGCRIVCSELPGETFAQAPRLAELVQSFPLPRMAAGDRPAIEELPVHLQRLHNALDKSLSEPPMVEAATFAALFRWPTVLADIETVWTRALQT